MNAAINLMARLKERAAAAGQLSLLWTGNDGWILSDGRYVIATDLDFYLDERIEPAPVEVKDLGPQLVFVTGSQNQCKNRLLYQRLVKSTCLILLLY